MFCDRCGTEVQSDHRFCSSCGREFFGAAAVYSRRSRVHEHVRLLGILWLAFSAFNAVGGVVLYVLAQTLFRHLPEMGAPPEVGAWLPTFVSFIGAAVVAKAAAGFIAGWGLLQRESWARILTIILAFLALFSIPFGTALGIYSLWVLLPSESEAAYQEQVRTVAA